MGNPLKISIITATMNRVDMIGRCIESVARQDYDSKEHVIVDGGSKDGTIDVIREYADRFPHIRWISESDRGLSEALNKGLKLMSGDLVGVLGDDDLYLPGAFNIVSREAEAHVEAGLILGDCDHIRNDGTVIRTWVTNYTNRKELIECWVHWGQDVRISAQAAFIRKGVIDDVGGFDERDRYAMDYRHWVKITERHGVHVVHDILAQFRADPDEGGSISVSLAKRQVDEMMAISREYWSTVSPADRLALRWSYYKTTYLKPALARRGIAVPGIGRLRNAIKKPNQVS